MPRTHAQGSGKDVHVATTCVMKEDIGIKIS